MDSFNITTEQSKELLDAQVHIWNHIFSFLTPMTLKCAIQLGIPDAIHKHGKPITLSELSNALDIHPIKAGSLHRLIRFLCHLNYLSKTQLPSSEPVFDLTINSQLLLKDHPFAFAPLVLAELDPLLTEPAHNLGGWLKTDEESPFHMAHGKSIWEHASLVPNFNECFNEAMAGDSRFVASLLFANVESKGLFEGIESLVDVGGGNGTMAKAIAKGYPGLKCIVFDLPHVVEGYLQENHGKDLIYIGGDMFEAIPQANAVLLKWILHDWSDEHCVKILERCKEAIPSKNQGGKIIIIDIVVKKQNDNVKKYENELLIDMQMMSVTSGGKERTEEEWKDLFLYAGFNNYKLSSLIGSRFVIEVYP